MAIFPIDEPEYAGIYAEEAAMVDAAELIADALSESGMSRVELARILQVSRSEITARLRGERNITVRSLAATLHALGRQIEFRSIPEPAAERPAVYRNWQLSADVTDHVELVGIEQSNWVKKDLVAR